MGACELCGAEGVSTRQAMVSQSKLECCIRCIDSMSLVVERTVTRNESQSEPESSVVGRGVSGVDIMTKDEMELAQDFHNRIRVSRKEKGLSQEDLARKMNVKIAVIQKAESGNRPTDALLKKFTKELGVRLFVESAPSNHTIVSSENDRKMTISDAQNDNVKSERVNRAKKKTRRLGVSRSGARSRR
ncbi:MAG: hypothetical protein CMB78_05900 [Euryarchaeota archaeon]|nr:hypothetical protein [Euryarchaeota archaeon]